MFSLIRGVIVIGLIFYFSPERDRSEPEQQALGDERGRTATISPPLPKDANRSDGLWSRIVGSLTGEVVRTAVDGKAQEAALRLKEASWALPEAPSKRASAAIPHSADNDAEGRTSPGQSVRCVYRCDGAE
jgi:hypothetical protein